MIRQLSRSMLWMLVFISVSFVISAQNTVTLSAVKDNVMYSENNNSNGSGSHLFGGVTNNGHLRRSLIQFDLSEIPANATITAVNFEITSNKLKRSSTTVSLHRLTSDWGEGSSNAPGNEGQGTGAATNDATWNFNFFDSSSWSNSGGDFIATPSASASASRGETSSFAGQQMIDDVQSWVDGSNPNFGWLIRGTEDGGNGNSVRINSRDASSNPPQLTITFETEAECMVDGGRIELTNGDTTLTICAGDGVSDAFDVTLTGNEGTNSAWVITDDQLNILGLPAAPPFDLEDAGFGICLVWHLSFEDGLTGAEVGANAADLMGCFDLSNPIEVTRDTTGDVCLTSTEILDPNEIELVMSPNPTNGFFNIQAKLKERPDQLILEVRTSLGNVVFSKELSNQLQVSEKIDISNLPEGFYLLSLRTENGIATRRLLKQ